MTYNEIHKALRGGSHANGRKEEAVVFIVRLLARPVSAGEVAEWVYGPIPWGHRRVVSNIRSLLDNAVRRGILSRTNAKYEALDMGETAHGEDLDRG